MEYNETNLDLFKEQISEENVKLKQDIRWWEDLKRDLKHFSTQINAGVTGGEVIDLVNILGLKIAYHYAFLNVIDNKEPHFKIQKLNKASIRLQNIDNIDFVEFIQVLIEFMKSTEYYKKKNVYDAIEKNYDSEIPIKAPINHLSRKVYKVDTLYSKNLLESVKLLDLFLASAYTGDMGELQDRRIICSEYFFDPIDKKDDIIEFVGEYDKIANDLIDLMKEHSTVNYGDIIIEIGRNKTLKEMLASVSLIAEESWKTPLYPKSDIKDLWERLYDSIPNSNFKTDKTKFKQQLLIYKTTFKKILYSMLINRNHYEYLKPTELKSEYHFEKSIDKTYDQFQVKLIMFYKKLLKHVLKGDYTSMEDHFKKRPDIYKHKKKLDFRLMDIYHCIDNEIQILSKSLHPRTKINYKDEDGYETSILPSTRQLHLYHPLLKMDEEEDSEDEMERIGQEYISNTPQGVDKDLKKKIQSVYLLLNKHIRESEGYDYTSNPDNIYPNLENIGKIVYLNNDSAEDLIIDAIIVDEIPYYLVAINGAEYIGPDGDYDYKYDEWESSRNYEGYVEVVQIKSEDIENKIKQVTNGKLFNESSKIEGDTLYWVEYFEVPTENVSRPWEMEAILRSGEIVVLPEDTDYRILLEYSDADIQVFLNIADVNIFEIGALASSYKKLKDIEKNEGIYKQFTNENEYGGPTYHLPYSNNKRGNTVLQYILNERGFPSNYLFDTVEKMVSYTPDKSFDNDELRKLTGLGMNIKPHTKNLFPERIQYLETIGENENEEYKSDVIIDHPFNKSKSDLEYKRETQIIKPGRDKFLKHLKSKQTTRTPRTLQRNWYQKHQEALYNDKGPLDTSELFEDDSELKPLQKNIKKSVLNKYGRKSRGLTPIQRLGISQEIMDREVNDRTALTNRLDRYRTERDDRMRQDRTIYDDMINLHRQNQ